MMGQSVPLGHSADSRLADALDQESHIRPLTAGQGWFDIGFSCGEGPGYAVYYDSVDRGLGDPIQPPEDGYIVTYGAGSSEEEIAEVSGPWEAVGAITHHHAMDVGCDW